MKKKAFFIFLISYFFVGAKNFAQLNFNFFVSNFGRDSSSGTSKTSPKQTISGIAPSLRNFAGISGSVALGLKDKDTFNEAIVPTFTIKVGAYNEETTHPGFATLNGSDVFDTGWTLSAGTTHTYEQEIQYTGFTGSGINDIGNYSYIYVIEVDKNLELTKPFTARKVLKFVPNIQSVDLEPGSFYEPVTSVNPGNKFIKIYLQTSDGSSPNQNNKYRYEVTVRDRAFDAYRNNDNSFENLWVRGYGAGYGSLPSGSNSHYNKIIFGPGAAIHHIVTKNAILNNCLFLPGPQNTTGGALVFYDVAGLRRHNKISNSIFIDIKTPIYAHTSGGTNFGVLELQNVVAFADTSNINSFMSAANNDSVLIGNSYISGFKIGYNNSSSKFVDIESSYFLIKRKGIYFGQNFIKASANNVFINSNGKDNASAIVMQLNTSLNLNNSIIHLKNSNGILNPDPVGFFVEGLGSTNHIKAFKNIFVCDVEQSKPVVAATTNNNNGIGTSIDNWDNNVYVLLRGNAILWKVTNSNLNAGNNNIYTFKEWQRQSGQDQHSLFFDLRNDPRGLQAIFLDPDNGNYELANTVEGNKVRAIHAGMTAPLHCYLKKPTYEEAAEMIRTEKVPTVNSCRNPCQQSKIKVDFSVAPGAGGLINICQDDSLTMNANGNYVENDTYYHQSDSRQRYLWWSSDEKDTSGVNLHSHTQTFQQPGPTDIRLQMVDENGCDYDTTFKVNVIAAPPKPDLGKDTSLCTGQTLPLEVKNFDANSDYTWSTGASGVAKIDVKEAGNYRVKNVDSRGCHSIDTITVLNKTPISVLLGRDTVFCASGTSGSKLLTATTTGTIQSYEWNTSSVANNIQITRPGTYIVTVRDFGVCVVSDTILIADNPVNTFTLPADTAICIGTSYQLTLTPPSATSITWNDGTTQLSRVITGGAYSLTAVNNGCIRKDSLFIRSISYPVVKLQADTTICVGYGLPLFASYPAATYLWSTGSRDSTIRVSHKGLYWVKVTTEGCSTSDSITLAVQKCDCNFEMPNAFSPNGDGVNDVIRPKMDCYPVDYNLSVFNRYGQVVYTTNDFTASWNGFVNGKTLPVGIYYYVVNIKNEGTPTIPISGSITLLR